MRNERVILCGDVKPSKAIGRRPPIRLNLCGNNANVALKITDITDKMVANLPAHFIDLLEIATFVYCADQATTRGGNGVRDYGSKWRREFHFHIPVREPDIWSSNHVLSALCDTLCFLSEDDYHFSFVKIKNPPSISEYLDFGSGGAAGFATEEVVLFSGGLDSLGGAIEEAVVGKRKIALVSHSSAPKIATYRRLLLDDLKEHCRVAPFHVPVWITKDKNLSREYTQRTRSFLYASLAAIVARMFDLHRLRFYENGVVSINLPISAQVLGGRASRTTHPQVINGYSRLFSALFETPFAVENPYLWKTKADVVQSIINSGCRDLIKHTVSCTHVRDMTRQWTHCGVCSQCVDRRFATLAAGCSDQDDPEEMYRVDLLTGPREVGEERTLLESYVHTAKEIRDMSDETFFEKFGEIYRVFKHINGGNTHGTATKILNLHKRHATQVLEVITQGSRDHTTDIYEEKLPDSCLLVVALPERYRKTTRQDDVPVSLPLLVLEEIKDGETNKNLLARIVGHGPFDGVSKKLGSRELFFVYLLFGSNDERFIEGQRLTVVTEEKATQELVRWSRSRYLRFTGKDKENPEYRIQKMWREFVRQIEKETKLKGLFKILRATSTEGGKLYTLCLRSNQKQVLLPNVPQLLRTARS